MQHRKKKTHAENKCLRKRTANHVSKFEVEHRKIGSRNQKFVPHRHVLTLYRECDAREISAENELGDVEDIDRFRHT